MSNKASSGSWTSVVLLLRTLAVADSTHLKAPFLITEEYSCSKSCSLDE